MFVTTVPVESLGFNFETYSATRVCYINLNNITSTKETLDSAYAVDITRFELGL